MADQNDYDPLDGGPFPKDHRIGALARHELNRLVEIDPKRTAIILRHCEGGFKENGYVIYQYAITANGEISGFETKGDTNITLIRVDNKIMIDIAPLGPVRFSDAEICIKIAQMPATKVTTLRENAIGTKLSTYIDMPRFDLDEMAPRGIIGARDSASTFDPLLILQYEMVTYPFAETAAALRTRISQLSSRKI